jgi:hypothetical protein
LSIQRGREATHANKEEGISWRGREAIMILGRKSCIPSHSREEKKQLLYFGLRAESFVFQEKKRSNCYLLGRAVSLVI